MTRSVLDGLPCWWSHQDGGPFARTVRHLVERGGVLVDVERQQRVFRAAVEAGHMQVAWTWPEGWSVRIVIRRGGEAWGEEPVAVYDGLSTPELLDVVCSAWARYLEL